MKIAVISGSPKSGKSFIATNLASVSNYAYFDCDFLNPNAPNYFEENNPQSSKHSEAFEIVNENNFITTNNDNNQPVFIGSSYNYQCDKVKVCYGKLEQANCEKLLFDKIVNENQFTNAYFDLPQSLSAFTLHAIKNADYCLIVEDASTVNFELFKGAVRAAKLLSKPYGIIFNKCSLVPPQFADYCYQQNANVLATFPNYLKEEKLISDCKILSKLKLTHKQTFLSLHQQIKKK